tara:strand:- start:18836 stop:20437 length:1602 start_codon:yes stop_codon:yes gene_type:complete
MANWKRVLLSGSHFKVAELTISDLPDAGTNAKVVFATSGSGAGTSGSFEATSSLALSNATTLAFVSGTFSGSFSGSGAGVTGVSATADKAIKAGAGFYILSNTSLGFNASPFIGSNGSNLTVALTGSAPGTNYGNADDDSTLADIINFNQGVSGGVNFMLGETIADNAELSLNTASLDGHGLRFSNQFHKLAIDLDESSNADTSFDLGSSGLKLASAVAGDGLVLENGVLRIDSASNSGLAVNELGGSGTDPGLHLANTVAGTGLNFQQNNNNHSVINIDGSTVVTQSVEITVDVDGPSISGFTNTIRGEGGISHGIITVRRQSDAGLTSTSPNSELSATFINNPRFEFDLATTWGSENDTNPNSDVTFENNVTVKGNLTIVSSSNITQLQADQFETSDAFLTLNSGSGDLFSKGGGIIVSRGTNNSGSAVAYVTGSVQRLFALTNPIGNAIGSINFDDTTVSTTGTPGTNIQSISLIFTASDENPNSSSPQFSDTETRGSWYIEGDRNPAGGESNVWIYTSDPGEGGGGGGD